MDTFPVCSIRPKTIELINDWAFEADQFGPEYSTMKEVAKLDPRAAKFIRWKMYQLAKADEKAGRCPSTQTLMNRFNWV